MRFAARDAGEFQAHGVAVHRAGPMNQHMLPAFALFCAGFFPVSAN